MSGTSNHPMDARPSSRLDDSASPTFPARTTQACPAAPLRSASSSLTGPVDIMPCTLSPSRGNGWSVIAGSGRRGDLDERCAARWFKVQLPALCGQVACCPHRIDGKASGARKGGGLGCRPEARTDAPDGVSSRRPCVGTAARSRPGRRRPRPRRSYSAAGRPRPPLGVTASPSTRSKTPAILRGSLPGSSSSPHTTS